MLHELIPPTATTPTRESTSDRTAGSRVGACQVATHFGELLQGKFNTDQGPTRALVTLPCPAFRAEVTARIGPEGSGVHTCPAGRTKAARAATLTMAHLGAPRCGVTLTIQSNILEGIGAGSSTGDVVATIHAVAAALGRDLTAEEVALITIETEEASDAIMFPFPAHRPRLFAHRQGRTIEVFAHGLPLLEVVGISDGAPVDTLQHPPAVYSTRTIREFDLLRAGMRQALAQDSAALLGAVASRSAEINQAFLPKPRFTIWMDFADRYGAVGLAVSHSGSAVGFIFDARDTRRGERVSALTEALVWARAAHVVHFQLGCN